MSDCIFCTLGTPIDNWGKSVSECKHCGRELLKGNT